VASRWAGRAEIQGDDFLGPAKPKTSAADPHIIVCLLHEYLSFDKVEKMFSSFLPYVGAPWSVNSISPNDV
jgi:hypothetical protein